jgi:DNA mismatch repair protein MutS2
LERKTPALVATHYAELKAFAHTTPGVQNASMEFDVETLSPTFHLTIGLPGRSNAFAIASRLGLDSRIIDEARAALSRGDVEMETLLAEIRHARQEASSAQAHAELKQREAERYAAEARRKLAEADRRRAEILEQAHADAKAEIDLAREELNRLRQEWRAVALTRDYIEGEVEKLDRLATQLPTPERPPTRREPMPQAAGPTGPEPLGVGDQVWVDRLGKAGEVVAIDGEGADVQVGSFRVHLKLDELGERVAQARPASSKEAVHVSVPQVESPGVEVSLRGMRADEALEKLDKYLDRAYMAGLPYVRVVHGKGTGTLRRLARELLSEHPLVAEIRQAAPHEGGEGVTIARLVSR